MGTLPTGQIGISQIRTELVQSTGSLRALSASAGKSSPDSMSEFQGYTLPSAVINMSENTGQLYDGCSMSLDSYGWFEVSDPDKGYIGPYGGAVDYNTERGYGTFLTYGGGSGATIHGRTGVYVASYCNGYGVSPCQPMYAFINVNGTRVANVQATAGEVGCAYSFTAAAGSTYTVEIGVWYGSV